MESAHREKVAEVAFKIFRIWTRGAALYYPKFNFTIIDETVLVDDLESVLLKAISNLKEETKAVRRKEEDYDYGYVVGYTEGNLNMKWMNDYVFKNTETYRNLVVCKAMLSFIKLDTEVGRKINKLYDILIKKDLNLLEINTAIDEEITEKYEISKVSRESFYIEKQSPVYMYLENQINKYVLDLIDRNDDDFMPNLQNYFEREFIEDLIVSYEKS